MVHIKQDTAKFQISKEYFPNQFLHPNNSSITVLGKTQETLNDNKRGTSKHNIVKMDIKVHTLFQYATHMVPTHRLRSIRLQKLK